MATFTGKETIEREINLTPESRKCLVDFFLLLAEVYRENRIKKESID